MDELAPSLPEVFDETGEWATADPLGNPEVIVFGGVPGSGKSTPAERVGAKVLTFVSSADERS